MMKTFNNVVAALAMLVLLVSALPVQAQDGGQDGDFSEEELALIERLADAFESFYALDSYAMAMEQAMIQVVTSDEMPGVEITVDLAQDIEGLVRLEEGGETVASDQVLEQEMLMEMPGTGPIEQTMTMESVIVGGNYYVRVPESSPPGTGFPTEWVNLTENPEAFPGADAFNLDTMTGLGNGLLQQLAVNETTVATIEELGTEEIDGQEMVIIQVKWNTRAMVESGAFGLDELLNLDAFEVDADALLDEFLDTASIVQRVWIGEDDGLIHRVEMDMSTMLEFDAGQGVGMMSLEQEITNYGTFSEFNEPVEIVAPIDEAVD